MTRNLDEQHQEVAAPVIDSSLEPGRTAVAHGSGTIRLPIVLALVSLTGLAYRALPLWDPGRPGIPDATEFFFNWSDTHPQVIYAAAGLLLFRRRREFSEALTGHGRPWLSAPFLGLSVLLFSWAKHTGAVDLELLSLLFLMPGAALLLFGPRFTRLLVLPMIVLAFAIPPPGVLANHVLLFLRLSGAAHGAWLLNAVGFTAFAEGTFVQAGPSPAEVIESCSGLRSIQTLTFLAAAWACFYSVRVPHAVALIALAPLIAYAVNVVRIAALALFPESDIGAMHSLQGVAMFLVGIGILALLDDRLRRLWPETSSHANRAPVAAREPDTNPRRSRSGMALTALLLAMVFASYLIPRWDDGQAGAGRVRLPDRLGDWQLREALKLHRQFLGSAFFGRLSYRAYERDGEVISVFVGYDDRRHRQRSLLSPIHAFNRPGWVVEERAPRSIAGLPEIEAVLARFQGIRDLSYWWVAGSAGMPEEALRAWLAADQSFLRRPAGVFVVRLSIDLKPRGAARDAAERSLREFSRLLSPSLKAPPQGDPKARLLEEPMALVRSQRPGLP